MLKRERGAESNGKLPHLFIPSKDAALVPEFAVKHLPLGRTLMMIYWLVVELKEENSILDRDLNPGL